MAMMSDLSQDLVEEILSRLPMTSLGAVRSTCKGWNTLSKNRILCKAEGHQFLGFTMMDQRLFSMRFNLHRIGLNENGEEFVDPSIKPIGNLLNQVVMSKIFYCDGLLLCVTMNNKRKLVVWNPYLGQTRWIQPKDDYREGAKYALGYDNKKNHKILRFFDRKGYYEIYDLKSNSWSLSNVIPNWQIYCCERYTSLKGNTYFISAKKNGGAGFNFILCFDFTTERFGQILPLPFKDYIWTLSCVKEEKLAVAVLCWKNTYVIEIWMTIKIDPNAASWSKFLRVDRKPPFGLGFVFANRDDSFFIDEEKKVAVVFSSDKVKTSTAANFQVSSIVCIEKAANFQESVEVGERMYCFSLLVCSCISYYVPSLVDINQISGRKSKDKKRKRTNKV